MIKQTIIAGIGALTLIGGLAACGSGSSSSQAASVTTGGSSSSQAASVTTSGSGSGTVTAPSPSPSPSGTVALLLAQKEQSWCNATGENDMSAVATDLNNLAADLNNDSLTGIAADGSSLYYDADTAWYDTLPSIDASDYQNAMNDYTRAGVYYSNADITDGNAYINAGSATFSNWTSAVTAAGSVCTGNEPNVTVSGPTPAATPTQAPLPAFECTYVTEVSSSSITLNIRGNGPDNAYAQATVKVVSGSWSQTVTIYRSSGWQSSRLQVGANAGDRCNVTTESAS